MESVDDIIDEILENEGGFVNDPDDPGGATNFGITHKTLAKYRGIISVSPDEVEDMDVKEAIEIYKSEYFFKPRFNLIDPPARVQVVDIGVNAGTKMASLILQRSIKDIGMTVVVDGVVGPKTAAKANFASSRYPVEFNNIIVERRIRYYDRIIERNPALEKFRKGWMNRSERYRL